ncbi:MAG: PPC domain-containing protein [Kiritimatiellae bacterium]|nr:PPC domain-containing protein [Kiritimatiellia bacterium]
MRMSPPGWLRIACVLLALGRVAYAVDPHIGYVYPAGARQGMKVDITVGGQFLEDTTEPVFTGKGVRARVVGYFKELTPQEINRLRNRIQKLEQTVESKTGDERTKMEDQMAEILDEFEAQGCNEKGRYLKGRRPDPKKQANAQLRERVTLRCTIGPQAKPGAYELRLKTPKGLSNAIVFQVGEVPEVRETEPNDREPEEDQQLTLPAVVNGQVMPGDIDQFRIHATQGQRLVCKVAARSLVPYLADAVPGWFQAALTLYGADGKELVFVDDDHFDPDPLLIYDVPVDGDYVLEIRDAIYRGREDFTYRLTIADARAMNGPIPTAVQGPARQKGDVSEKEPNNTPDSAQSITLPAVVHGGINQPGEWDLYAFEGRAGQSVVVETRARRDGSPLDSVLQLKGPGGKVIAVSDDHVDRREGLVTHHADSYIVEKLPADGRYTVHLGDIQGKGSKEHAYRLRVTPSRPGFDLRVTPATLSVTPGGSVPLTVHVFRRDGFEGPVKLALAGGPEGARLSGGAIPPGQEKTHATITVPWKTPEGTAEIALKGEARIGGHIVRKTAVPAEDRMQAFLWRHLVPVEQWVLSVVQGPRIVVQTDLPESGELELLAGQETEIVLHNPARKPIKRMPRCELYEPPDGLELVKTAQRNNKKEVILTLKVNSEKLKPGTEGNLVVTILAPNKKVRKVLGAVPAIRFRVVSL